MRTLYSLFFFTLICTPILSYGVPDKISNAVKKHCGGLDRHIVLGILKTENHFRNRNRSEKDGIRSMGVMQVRYPTAKFIKCPVRRERDLQMISTNIQCGCSYLRYQQKRYQGNVYAMVASYQTGTAFRRGKGYVNQTYVNNVFRHARGFREHTWN